MIASMQRSNQKQIDMKSRTLFSAVHTILLALAVAAITIPATTYAMSADPFEKPADVQYLGSRGQTLMFTVTYNNATAARFFVTIKDENGGTLFQQAFTENKFNRKFILPKTETGKFTFIISDKKNRHSETFEVSTQTRTVEDVVVKKLQ